MLLRIACLEQEFIVIFGPLFYTCHFPEGPWIPNPQPRPFTYFPTKFGPPYSGKVVDMTYAGETEDPAQTASLAILFRTPSSLLNKSRPAPGMR